MGVLFAIIVVICTVNYGRNPDLIPPPAGLPNTQRPAYDAGRAPELAEDRKVTEQDCSKPVDLSDGNLRCK